MLPPPRRTRRGPRARPATVITITATHAHSCASEPGHSPANGSDALAHEPLVYPLDGAHCRTHRGPYSWIGLGAGLALHTLIDGIALAASVAAATAPDQSAGLQLLGVGTFLAVVLHKPLDAMSITSVMLAGGALPRARQIVNLAFAGMCPLGAAAFYLGVQQVTGHQEAVVGLALGFAAGVFLCISLADILPEVQFHSHDRFKLSAALLSGVLLAYAIGFVEPGHQHEPGHSHAATVQPADGEHHADD